MLCPPPQGSSELVLRKLKITPKIATKISSVNGPLGQENVLNRPFEINFVASSHTILPCPNICDRKHNFSCITPDSNLIVLGRDSIRQYSAVSILDKFRPGTDRESAQLWQIRVMYFHIVLDTMTWKQHEERLF